MGIRRLSDIGVEDRSCNLKTQDPHRSISDHSGYLFLSSSRRTSLCCTYAAAPRPHVEYRVSLLQSWLLLVKIGAQKDAQ